MSGRTLAAFALGFAVGCLCLAGFVWWSRASGQHQGAPEVSGRRPAPPAPSPGLPDLRGSSRLRKPRLEFPPLPRTPAHQGEAERLAPEPQLAMPLEGIDPHTLRDTFHDARDGHEHEALDIPAPRGTPVHAVAEGNVAKLFNSKQGGLTVYQFDNSQTWCYYYAHLDHYATELKEGTLLRKGDVLGYVGTTGNAPQDAPHLHFAVFKLGPEKNWWKGEAVDPLPMLE